MSKIQRIELPRDGNQKTMQIVPPVEALATTYNASISSQVEVTLNANTSFIEVSAISAPILMKYKTVAGGTSVSTTNFSEFIQAGCTRHYQLPIGTTVLAFKEQAATATLVLIEK
jgi:hypothetical protein